MLDSETAASYLTAIGTHEQPDSAHGIEMNVVLKQECTSPVLGM